MVFPSAASSLRAALVRPCILPSSPSSSGKPRVRANIARKVRFASPPVSAPVTSLRLSRLPLAPSLASVKPALRRFEDMRTGSRLPVRQARMTLPSVLSTPSAGQLSGILAERREARQARSRPWAEPPSRVAPRRTQTGTPHLPPATRGPPVRIQNVVSDSLTRSATVTSRQARTVPAKAVAIPRRRALASSAPLKCAPSSSSVGGRSRLPIAKAKVTLPTVQAGGKQTLEPRKKHVSFGTSTVTEVSRWITPDDVYQNLPREFVRGLSRGSRWRLHGWLLIPTASEPLFIFDESFSSASKLDRHMERPCKDSCAWHCLAMVSRRFPECSNKQVFQKWNVLRGFG